MGYRAGRNIDGRLAGLLASGAARAMPAKESPATTALVASSGGRRTSVGVLTRILLFAVLRAEFPNVQGSPGFQITDLSEVLERFNFQTFGCIQIKYMQTFFENLSIAVTRRSLRLRHGRLGIDWRQDTQRTLDEITFN